MMGVKHEVDCIAIIQFRMVLELALDFYSS